jgi:hypothetical protein
MLRLLLQGVWIFSLQQKQAIEINPGIQLVERREDRITDAQKRLLNMNYFTNQDILDLSKSEASTLISKVKSNSNWKRATKEQRLILRNAGYPAIKTLLFSEEEASKVINELPGKGKW